MEERIYKKIDDEVMAKLHGVELEIFKEFVRICKKHNLKYFLIAGTLIGAVRHGGFIPWDDDMDVGMPREDYDKFLEVGCREISDKYFIHCSKTDNNYWLPFAKIRKNNTTFVEQLLEGKKVLHNGIFIDVFPMDNASNFYFINRIKAFFIRSISDDLLVRNNILTLKESRHPAINRVLNLFSINFLQNIQYKLMVSHNNNSKYLVNWGGAYHIKKELVLREVIYPLKELDFENISCKVANRSGDYLTGVYGDYMKLPSEEERVNHGSCYISFDEGSNKISKLIK